MAGSKVRLSVTFTDANAAAIDPTTVSVEYGAPGVAPTTQTYNPGNVVRDGVGLYHYDLDTTSLSGLIDYDWISTGTGQAAAGGQLVVQAQPI